MYEQKFQNCGRFKRRLQVLVRFSTLPFWLILELLALLCAWLLVLPFPKATKAIMIWAHNFIPNAEWYFCKSNVKPDLPCAKR